MKPGSNRAKCLVSIQFEVTTLRRNQGRWDQMPVYYFKEYSFLYLQKKNNKSINKSSLSSLYKYHRKFASCFLFHTWSLSHIFQVQFWGKYYLIQFLYAVFYWLASLTPLPKTFSLFFFSTTEAIRIMVDLIKVKESICKSIFLLFSLWNTKSLRIQIRESRGTWEENIQH